MDPYDGAKQDGYRGLLKGFGVGTLDLFVRASAGTFIFHAGFNRQVFGLYQRTV
jgi:hypothetical protein